MTRGRTTGSYNTDAHGDEPAVFNVDVPNNLYAEASMGWTAGTSGAPTMAKNFHPRHVLGVDTTGHRVKAIVADPTADLWTGTATTWTFLDNSGGSQTATVTGYAGEKYTVR